MRPNCLLIRLVRGVIFKGKEFLGLFDTNRLAYQKFPQSKEKRKDNKTDGLRILSAHAVAPIVVLVYTQSIIDI